MLHDNSHVQVGRSVTSTLLTSGSKDTDLTVISFKGLALGALDGPRALLAVALLVGHD